VLTFEIGHFGSVNMFGRNKVYTDIVSAYIFMTAVYYAGEYITFLTNNHRQ